MKTSSFIQFNRHEIRKEFLRPGTASMIPPIDYGAIDAPSKIPAGFTVLGKYSKLPIQPSISRELK